MIDPYNHMCIFLFSFVFRTTLSLTFYISWLLSQCSSTRDPWEMVNSVSSVNSGGTVAQPGTPVKLSIRSIRSNLATRWLYAGPLWIGQLGQFGKFRRHSGSTRDPCKIVNSVNSVKSVNYGFAVALPGTPVKLSIRSIRSILASRQIYPGPL